MKDDSIEIIKVKEVLSYNLEIPGYQRPYKWTTKNIIDLLTDIEDAIISSEKKHIDCKLYRIGTVILYDNKEKNVFEIVDGQQRLISLSLISLRLDKKVESSLFKTNFMSKISQYNINNNYKFINDWFNAKNKDDNYINKFKNFFDNNLEFVLLKVNDISQAFQLFDSQNNRGKELDPHDLLKAYHLREMSNIGKKERKEVVNKWEEEKPKDIRDLYSNYLYPIKNWSRLTKSTLFSSKNIDAFKGVKKNSKYNFAKRVKKIERNYQITEPYVAGVSFFEYTDHYLKIYISIKDKIRKYFPIINEIINNIEYNKSIGFRYTKNLFYAAVLCYYDRFHEFDYNGIMNIFKWAFMLRVDIINLGYDSINKYAIGEQNEKYSNCIPMFSIICNSYDHRDISRLNIEVKKQKDNKWESLYNELLNAYKGELN